MRVAESQLLGMLNYKPRSQLRIAVVRNKAAPSSVAAAYDMMIPSKQLYIRLFGFLCTFVASGGFWCVA